MSFSSSRGIALWYSTIQSAEQELFPLVAAIGVGFLYQIPIVALQAAMPTKDMATATSGFMFLR